MSWGENSNFQKVVFQEVDAPSRLVWHHYSSTDAQWNSVANPMMANWPRLLLTTVNFEDKGSATIVVLTQTPMDATPEEIAFFGQAMSGMDKGWGSGFDIIAEILAEMQT